MTTQFNDKPNVQLLIKDMWYVYFPIIKIEDYYFVMRWWLDTEVMNNDTTSVQ